ncbi:MAG: SGNH/GDSL hydrolase family protein [Muribaculaceae bacterium]|nr:SGNH/GDSL hydrolase family protein [Muribaculaceae bacterium]
MNRPLKGLLALLVIALAIFALASFLPQGIKLGPWTIKTASFAEALFAPAEEVSSASSASAQVGADGASTASDTPKAPDRPVQMPLDTTAKTILFIGDSMLEGLGPRMAAYAEENGHTLVNVIWYSSTTEVWGSSTRLKENIDTFHPDYVFVCLGANELFVRDIVKKRQQYLNNMLSQIGNLPYVWIGPPNWKPDTGINDMLQATCQPGCFYLSNGEHFDRAKDGAHPTRASASAWADRVCRWVMTKSAHPIKLNVPTQARAHCRTIVYQPQR